MIKIIWGNIAGIIYTMRLEYIRKILHELLARNYRPIPSIEFLIHNEYI